MHDSKSSERGEHTAQETQQTRFTSRRVSHIVTSNLATKLMPLENTSRGSMLLKRDSSLYDQKQLQSDIQSRRKSMMRSPSPINKLPKLSKN